MIRPRLAWSGPPTSRVGYDRKEPGGDRTDLAVIPHPPAAEEFRQLMGYWPTGVTVVTTADREVPVGCTVEALMSASLTPPLLVVALGVNSTTLAAIRRSGRFPLNMLAAGQDDLCGRFARSPQPERFRDLPHYWRAGVLLLSDTVAVCVVDRSLGCGDHVLVVATPVWQTAGEHGSPLVFHRRKYHALGETDSEGRPC